MHRGILITVVAVLVLAIAGVGLALFWNPAGNSNLANNTNAVANSNNSENTNVSDPELQNSDIEYRGEELDTKEVQQVVTYRDAEIPIDRVEIKTGVDYNGPVEEGKKVVYVFLAKEPLKHTEHISTWLNEIKLQDSQGRQYSVDRGIFPAVLQYEVNQPQLQFFVDQDAKDFSLVFTRSGEEKTVELGI